MDVIIGCDNAGVWLKDQLADHLRKQGVGVEDLGCFSVEDETYYPLIAKDVCQALQKRQGEARGLLICGTGIGMAITANKFKGIRAAVCHDNYSCERSVLSNNCNVLCLGARVIGLELAKKIVNEWTSLRFKDGSSTPKVQTIADIEEETFQPE